MQVPFRPFVVSLLRVAENRKEAFDFRFKYLLMVFWKKEKIKFEGHKLAEAKILRKIVSVLNSILNLVTTI